LQKASKKVPGRRRSIPFSNEKAKRLATLGYWKELLGQKQGKRISNKMIERRIFINLLLIQEISITELKAKVEEAVKEWKELKEKLMEFWLKDILDRNNMVLLEGESIDNPAK